MVGRGTPEAHDELRAQAYPGLTPAKAALPNG
jgi:hypothetical protein